MAEEVRVEYPTTIKRICCPPLFAGQPGAKKKFFSLSLDEEGTPLIKIGNPNEEGDYATLFFKAEAGELMNLAEGLETYRLEGFSAFKEFAKRVNPSTPLNEKKEYASLTFVHRSEGKSEGKNFITSNVFALVVKKEKQEEHLQFRMSKKVMEAEGKKGKEKKKNVVEEIKVSFPIGYGELRKLEEMFKVVAEAAFQNELTKATIREIEREEEFRKQREQDKQNEVDDVPEIPEEGEEELPEGELPETDYSVDDLLEGGAEEPEGSEMDEAPPAEEPPAETPKSRRLRRRGASMSMG